MCIPLPCHLGARGRVVWNHLVGRGVDDVEGLSPLGVVVNRVKSNGGGLILLWAWKFWLLISHFICKLCIELTLATVFN